MCLSRIPEESETILSWTWLMGQMRKRLESQLSLSLTALCFSFAWSWPLMLAAHTCNICSETNNKGMHLSLRAKCLVLPLFSHPQRTFSQQHRPWVPTLLLHGHKVEWGWGVRHLHLVVFLGCWKHLKYMNLRSAAYSVLISQLLRSTIRVLQILRCSESISSWMLPRRVHALHTSTSSSWCFKKGI